MSVLNNLGRPRLAHSPETMSGSFQARDGKSPHESSSAQHLATQMNWMLTDPPKWGWTAVGGIADLLPPHERAQRKSTRNEFRKQKRKGQKVSRPTSQAKTTGLPASYEQASRSTKPTALNQASLVGAIPQQQAIPAATVPPAPTPNEQSLTVSMPLATAGLPQPIPLAGLPLAAPGPGLTGSALGPLPTPPSGPVIPAVDSVQLFWGISMNEKQDTEPCQAKKPKGKGKRRQKTMICSVNALQPAQGDAGEMSQLDIYSYHRGREGMEPRRRGTGELLCPCTATDTNFDTDAPKVFFHVTIEFPLEDEDPGDTFHSPPAMYKQTFPWDLNDPATPSPMEFATSIANDFGLSFGQTENLALSIQGQIDEHLQHHVHFTTPLSIQDTYGNTRKKNPPLGLLNRFDSVLRTVDGGIRLPKVSKRQVAPKQAPQPKSVATTIKRQISHQQDRRRDSGEEKVDAQFRHEVVRRATEASKKVFAQNPTVLSREEDCYCHGCYKRAPVAYIFPCGSSSHSFCPMHCKDVLGIDVDNGEPPISTHCPVCSLQCPCARCTRKLEHVATEFKAACISQSTVNCVLNTKFDGILKKCSTGARGTFLASRRFANPNQPEKKNSRRSKMVPKPPLLDFPREVAANVEIDTGVAEDYLKVYTANGSFLTDDFPPIWSQQCSDGVSSDDASPPASGQITEDGNVDYCNVCKNAGNLLCCDECPRGFHIECLGRNYVPSLSGKWECTICKKENTGSDEDALDGKTSLDIVSKGCDGTHWDENDRTSLLKVISVVDEMIVKLIEYDFGYMFSNPVNCKAVPGYLVVVKKPMDLGTIRKNMANGKYFTKGLSKDSAILAILTDIELVWHNCYSYNYEGSAIYRMADVLRKVARNIRKRSFESLISDYVKTTVQTFIETCELGRKKATPVTAATKPTPAQGKESELRARRPKGKHKVSVTLGNRVHARAVAILDPTAGRVVKIYSSVKSAIQAAQALVGLGHRCEFCMGDIKSVVHESKKDPSLRLFGYRWVILEDLRGGKVRFPDDSSLNTVGMRDSGALLMFSSIDEALSSPNVPRSVTIAAMRAHLEGLLPGADWTKIQERDWRILDAKNSATSQPERANAEDKATSDLPLDTIPMVSGVVHLSDPVYMKKDLVTNRNLVGFSSAPAVFDDWKAMASSSPTYPVSDPKTIEYFKQYYLDGARNIDGIVWRTVPKDGSANVKNQFQVPVAPPTKNGIEGVQETSSSPPENGVTTGGDGQSSNDSNSIMGKRKRADVPDFWQKEASTKASSPSNVTACPTT